MGTSHVTSLSTLGWFLWFGWQGFSETHYMTIHYDLVTSIQEMDIHSGMRWALGEPTATRSAVFLNIVQKAFDPHPPPFVLNIMLQIFLMDFLKSA